MQSSGLDVCPFCRLSGDTQVLAQVSNSAGSSVGTVGALASRHGPRTPAGSDSWQAGLLVYNSDDNRTCSSPDQVTVSLAGLAAQTGTTAPSHSGVPARLHPALSPAHLHPSPGLVYVTYYLDNNVSNPFRLWKDWGAPDYPTAQQFRLLRSLQVRSRLPRDSRGLALICDVLFVGVRTPMSMDPGGFLLETP